MKDEQEKQLSLFILHPSSFILFFGLRDPPRLDAGHSTQARQDGQREERVEVAAFKGRLSRLGPPRLDHLLELVGAGPVEEIVTLLAILKLVGDLPETELGAVLGGQE